MSRPEEAADLARPEGRRVPKIQPTDLRDVASDDRVERVWSRLEQDLDTLRARPAPRPSRAAVWAVAATFAGLSTGLVAGRLLWKSSEPGTSQVVAARDLATLDVFAAGSQERSYSLPGGGTITLTPGSMVELERTGGRDLRLRLLSGEASLDTGQAPGQSLAIVSGEATIETAPGSMVSVQKRADALDVRVVGGSAQVSSPAGRHALRKGEQMEDVPTRTTTTAVTPPVVRVSPVLGPTARVARDAPVAAVATAPTTWRELHAAGKFDDALVALRAQSGSLTAAVSGASGAKELMEISDLARSSKGDGQAAIAALTRVADSFGSSAYGPIAAKQLATHYAQTQPDLAKKYLDQAARKGVFSEDAMCAQMVSEEQAGNKDEASARASEYLAKHPNGRCKDDATRILAGGDADGDEEPPAPAPTAASTGSAPAGAASSAVPAALSAPAPSAPAPKP